MAGAVSRASGAGMHQIGQLAIDYRAHATQRNTLAEQSASLELLLLRRGKWPLRSAAPVVPVGSGPLKR